MELQRKINYLHDLAYRLLHIECSGNYLFIEDLSQLNKDIYESINELYSLRGSTLEQEATLCLALLMGYSVIMYASAEDDLRKETILVRSQQILERLSPSSLKQDLLTVCQEYASL